MSESGMRILVEYLADGQLWSATTFFNDLRLFDHTHPARGRAILMAREAAAGWLVDEGLPVQIEVIDLETLEGE